MPMKLNVGFCRKVGEPDDGSREASTNLEIELDSTLAGDPQRLRQHIHRLFALAQDCVNEQLDHSQSPPPKRNPKPNGQSNPDADRGTPSRQSNGNGRRATESQIKAIYAISKQNGIDLANLLRDRFNVSRPNDLSLQEASSVIDELKGTAADNRS